MSARRVDVLVLGGGLAGLTAAAELRAGDGGAAGAGGIAVLEARDTAGGLLRTAWYGDLAIDELPHVFFSRDDAALRRFRELVPDAEARDARLGVWAERRFADYPFQLHIHQLPGPLRLACLRDYLAAARRPPGAARPDDFATLLRTRFGDAMVEALFRPYNEKLWRIPLEELATDWVGAKIDDVDDEDMARSFLGPLDGARRRFGPHARFHYPRSGGIERLAEALVERVGADRVHTGQRVTRVDLEARRVETKDGAWRYDRLLWTLPLTDVPALTGVAAVPAARLRCNRVTALHLRAPVSMPDYHWVYLVDPALAAYRLTRVDLLRGVATPDAAPLIVEVAGADAEDTDDDALAARVVAQLSDAGVLADDRRVELLGSYRHRPAYVIHDRRRPAAVRAIHDALAAHGVVCAGRFGDWSFLNMDHTMASAIAATRRLRASRGDREGGR